jgi:hypothetical protein
MAVDTPAVEDPAGRRSTAVLAQGRARNRAFEYHFSILKSKFRSNGATLLPASNLRFQFPREKMVHFQACFKPEYFLTLLQRIAAGRSIS